MFVRTAASTFALILGVAASTDVVRAQMTLRHSAPFLGRTLELSLEGAPPGASVALFESTSSSAVATPFGVWELERAHAQLVALGSADSSGSFRYAWDVPLVTMSAEAPRHYQALVRNAGATMLSPAVHLRLLASRAYVLSAGDATPGAETSGSLTVVSMYSGARPFQLWFGAPLTDVPPRAEPAFDEHVSRGAILISRSELSFFDPFFGAEIARVAVAPAVGRLVTDAEERVVHAFSPGDAAAGAPARVQRFELSTAAALPEIALPAGRYEPAWIANLERTFAYAIGFDPVARRYFAERIDLTAGADAGRLPIAAAGFDRLQDMTASARSVFVLTRRQVDFNTWEGLLTRIDEDGGAQVSVTPWGANVLSMTAAPQFGVFASIHGFPTMPGVSLVLARMSDPTSIGWSGPIWSADTAYRALPVRSGVFLHTYSTDGVGHELAYVNYAHDWFLIALGSYPPQIVDIAAVEDAGGQRAAALVREFDGGQPGTQWPGTLYLFNPYSSTIGELEVGPVPCSVTAVPIP